MDGAFRGQPDGLDLMDTGISSRSGTHGAGFLAAAFLAQLLLRQRGSSPVQRLTCRWRPVPATKILGARERSEEHTSELQSHLNLVCRLLLEKKKKKAKNVTN